MSYTKEGSCIQCGKCCQEPVMGNPKMLSATNPSKCKYLSLDGELHICLITAGKFETPTAKEPEIPEYDYDYWLAECQPYPDPKSDAHTPPIHELPKECGYRIV